MNPFEPIQALIGYGFLLFFPGFLWTFLFPSISKTLTIIERIVLTVGISISAVPLVIFFTNILFGLTINGISIFILSLFIGCIPILIVVLKTVIQKKEIIKKIELCKIEVIDWIKYVILKIKAIPKLKHYLILTSIILFGITLNLIPHFDYHLPLHTDEWHYIIYSNTLINTGDVVVHWETGYLIFISSFKLLSGVSWPFLFNTLPTVIFIFVMLTAYCIGERLRFGLYAAFLVALVPSSVRFLGPVFLVPIALGLLLVLICIYFILRFQNKSKYLILVPIISFAFLMHPATGIYLFMILIGILFIFGIKKEWNEFLMLGGLLLCFLSFMLYLPQTPFYNVNLNYITQSGRFFLPEFGFDKFIRYSGFIPVILFTIGLGKLARENKSYSLGLVTSVLVMVAFLSIIYYVFPNFYNVQAVYDRAIELTVLLIFIAAGCGLYYIFYRKKVLLPFIVACIILISIPAHVDEPYYHIIDTAEYDEFLWIKENLNEEYDKAILDPWKAVAFVPVTEKSAYLKIGQGPGGMEPMMSNLERFFLEGCTDTDFLIDNGINIVYTDTICVNSNLINVYNNVYILNYSLLG